MVFLSFIELDGNHKLGRGCFGGICSCNCAKRKSHSPHEFEFFTLQISESFKERLLEFHDRAGLVFGAYDFLERGDDVIFLECNPRGAWL